jgi:hypothetical protein
MGWPPAPALPPKRVQEGAVGRDQLAFDKVSGSISNRL